MPTRLLLTMSIISFLFGCTSKKTPKKVEEWPRFPATDNSEITVTPISLADGYRLSSFYIAPDKQYLYVLASRIPVNESELENGEKRPGDPDYVDYLLLCLDTSGQIKFQKEMLHTDWMYGGTFGLLEGELLLRIGDWFLVLEPKTFDVKEKIPVHDSRYIPWKEPEMTRDEHQADYQAKFNALQDHCKTCRWLYWPSGQEYMVFVQGTVGKRSAWTPMSYEDDLLADLKQRFEPLMVPINPQAMNDDSNRIDITDASAHLLEVEYLSAGTQLDYPNYKSRSVLQYELTVNNKKGRFSTTDKDRHNLHLGFSDNWMLSMADGAVWVVYEGVLYRIQ